MTTATTPERHVQAVDDAVGRSVTPAPAPRAHRGQILLMVAIMATVLLGLVAMVTDTAMIWLSRRGLQNAVDAAALAGAQELPDETVGAEAFACAYAADNAVTGMFGKAGNCGGQADVDIAWSGWGDTAINDQITVTAYRQVQPIFGGFVGWGGVEVWADATAVVGSLHTLCVFPIFQTYDRLEASGVWVPDGDGTYVEFNTPTILKTNSDDSSQGNFLYLQVNGSSSKADIRGAIGSVDGCAQQTSDIAETAPGDAVGPLDQGMEIRAGHWNNASLPGYCPPASPTFNADGIAVHPAGHPLAGQPLTPENCYRVIQIPMLEGVATDYSGQSSGQIVGYLTFYIANWCGQTSDPQKGDPDSQHCPAPAGTSLEPLGWGELWGYYLEYETVTDNPIQPYDGLGTKVVVLID